MENSNQENVIHIPADVCLGPPCDISDCFFLVGSLYSVPNNCPAWVCSCAWLLSIVAPPLCQMGVSAGAGSSRPSNGAVRHNSGFLYAYPRDAFADLEYGTFGQKMTKQLKLTVPGVTFFWLGMLGRVNVLKFCKLLL